LLAEPDEEGADSEDRFQARSGHSVSGLAQPHRQGAFAVTDAQVICLSIMFVIGYGGVFGLPSWEERSFRQRMAIIAWLVFWLGPPMYFIWTKGVMG